MSPEKAPGQQYPLPGLFSFSPYVVNHKHRRGGGNSEFPDLPSDYEGSGSNFEEEVGDNFGNLEINANDDDNEGFVDTKSETSEVEIGCFLAGKHFDSRSSVSARGDFFDANDDFSSDGSRTESELHLTRLTILEEIERRKRAEEALIVMRCQWEMIGNLMYRAGLTCPAPPSTSDDITETENGSIDNFIQEVIVARFVAVAVGRGEARAEAEEAGATIVESKDQEIVRLRDRLHYYETVNHELSQRKLVEVVHKQQERKIKRRRRWMWRGFVGKSVAAIGASFAAYSYVPRVTDHAFSVDTGT